MKILVGGISTKFASCSSGNPSQMSSYKKKKKKNHKSKENGRGKSSTDESFQEISERGEENQHRKLVEKGEWKAGAAPRQGLFLSFVKA